MCKRRFASQTMYLLLLALMVMILVACRGDDDRVSEQTESAPIANITPNVNSDTAIYTAEDLHVLLMSSFDLNQAEDQSRKGSRGRGNENGSQRNDDHNQRDTELGRRSGNPLINIGHEQIRLQDNAVEFLDPRSGEPITTLNLLLVNGQLQGQVEAPQHGEEHSFQNGFLSNLSANFVEALMDDLQAKGKDGSITRLSTANGNLEIGF